MLLGFAAQIVKGSIKVLYNGNYEHEMVGLFQWLLFICLFLSTKRALLTMPFGERIQPAKICVGSLPQPCGDRVR